MKKIVAFTALAGFVTASFLSGCGDASKQHVKDAGGNLKEAGEDLKEAAKDANDEAKRKAIADWQTFKNESDSVTAAIDEQVLDLKAKIAKANDKKKAKLNSELDKLEQNLNEQKAKLEQTSAAFEADLRTFNETMITKHESFKREFKHDNEELSAALKDLFKDNVK